MAHRIFLYGRQGSGKSTLCACVAYYFWAGDHTIAMSPNVVDNPDGTNYIEDWINLLGARQFPLATEAGTSHKLDIALEDVQAGHRFGISFYEAAGEELLKIDPTHEQYADRDPTFERWIDDAEMFILVGPVNRADKDHFALAKFVTILRQRGVVDKPILFVVSKWDKRTDTKSPWARVVDREYKGLLRNIQSRVFTGGTHVLPFSVGAVSPDGATIESLDLGGDIKKVADWIIEMRIRRDTGRRSSWFGR